MPELQAIIDFSIQINKFINIDLFQRGFYQIRLSLRLPNCKLINKIELKQQLNRTKNNIRTTKSDSSFSSNFTTTNHHDHDHNHDDGCGNNNVSNQEQQESNRIFLPSCIIEGMSVTKTFQINYKNEEIPLNDLIHYRMNICLDMINCLEQMQKTNIELIIQLWYSDQEFLLNQFDTFSCVSSRQLRLHFDLLNGLHYSLPVIFDYFHLSAITLSIHGCLIQLCQPYISTSKNNPATATNWLSSFLVKPSPTQSDNVNGKKINDTFFLQLWRLQFAQWKLISIMSISLINLKNACDEYYRILTPWTQAKINYKELFVSVSLDNFHSKLSKDCFQQIQNHLRNVQNNLNIQMFLEEFFMEKFPENNFHSYLLSNEQKQFDDDYIDQIEHDIAYLSGLTIEQWQRFLIVVENSERINQYLARIHHFQRLRRFSEAFFRIKQSRTNLNGSICDQNSNLFLDLSDNLRKSSYFINLPSCDVECLQLDGDYQTLPIIFEEKFEYQKTITNGSGGGDDKKSPSKLSLSSSTTTTSTSSSSSSISPRSNSIRFSFLSRFNSNNNNDNCQKQSSSSNNNKLQKNCQSELKTMELFELYKQELFNQTSNNNSNDKIDTMEQMNRKIKLLNSMLARKNSMIKNYSQLKSLDFHQNNDKIFKKSLKSSQNSESTKPSSSSKLTAIESTISCHSWPELLPKTIYDEENDEQNEVKKISKKHHHNHRNKEQIFDIFPSVNYQNFPGTMYFPKPPKEFAMEEMIDEPESHEICMKPIPNIRLQKPNNDNENPKISIQHVFSQNPVDNPHHSKINNSLSFHDLTDVDDDGKQITIDDQQQKPSSNIDLKSENLNYTKFTFMELLRSDHCLICCGSIDMKRSSTTTTTDSWPCKCIRTPTFVSKSVRNSPNTNSKQLKQEKFEEEKEKDQIKTNELSTAATTTVPTFRRTSLFDSEFLTFLNEKETFRQSIIVGSGGDKIPNLIFYSDFTKFASRIPYFQCDTDFKSFKDIHLIVCVHGLDGNSADLRLVKTYLEIGLPTINFEFLMSQRNQGETFDSLETLTERLINEIENFVSTLKSIPTKISFIGHSLGNIIIRAAISRTDFLKRWRNKFHTFLSLSGPHLGLAYNRSGLVNMGLWFIQKFKRAQSLNQLSMKDSTDIKQTFLYRLSMKSGLEFFNNILLCGSSQDYYVPIHSAHIELCNAAINDQSDYGIAYREMTDNIIKRLMSRPELNVIRYDVHHALNNNTNSLIGRAAHIAVLDSELFIEKFMMVTGLGYFV